MTPVAETVESTISFTLDLEDPRPDDSHSPRYRTVTGHLLEHLAGLGIRGTVFTVGTLASEAPDLIRRAGALGHEIGFHSARHIPLVAENPERFQAECVDGRHRLEDLSGRAVLGFRAPLFSLTAATTWAVPILQETGFVYSSSVLPAPNPLYGYPGAPRQVFRWPGGLLEIPVPVAQLGPFSVPYLGGVYLRYLPLGLIRALARHSADAQLHWTYCHPYDFDPGQPFYRMQGTSYIISLLLWFNRRNTLDKLTRLLGNGAAAGRPFAEDIAAGRFDHVPVFDPDASQ